MELYNCLPSTGLVERFHRHFKSALRARLRGPNWMDELPWILLGIRTTPKDDLGTSSAELVYRCPVSVPGDFLHSPNTIPPPHQKLRQLREHAGSLAPVPTSQHGPVTPFVPHTLTVSPYVLVRTATRCRRPTLARIRSSAGLTRPLSSIMAAARRQCP